MQGGLVLQVSVDVHIELIRGLECPTAHRAQTTGQGEVRLALTSLGALGCFVCSLSLDACPVGLECRFALALFPAHFLRGGLFARRGSL